MSGYNIFVPGKIIPKKILPVLILSSCFFYCSGNIEPAPSVFPQKTWGQGDPEKFGINIQPLKVLQEYIGGAGIIIKGGYNIWSWGDTDKIFDVASAVKPVLAYFFFKKLQDKQIKSIDSLIKEFEPDIDSIGIGLDPGKAQITWRHLLNQMSCYGMTELPGAAFDYNDYQTALFWDTLVKKIYRVMPSDINEQILEKELGSLLGWEDQPFMEKGEENLGRLKISCRDFARFGYLYLRKGQWNNKEVLSNEVLSITTNSPLPPELPRTKGIPSNMIQGQRTFGGGVNQEDHRGSYSFFWWVNGRDENGQLFWPDVPTDTFAAIGYGGVRSLIVIPSLDMVICWMGEQTSVIPEIISKDGRWYINEALRLVVASTRPGENDLFDRKSETHLLLRHSEDVTHLINQKRGLKSLGVFGHMPSCVADRNGRLHIVFVSGNKIHYLAIGKDEGPLTTVQVPGSDNGLRPWIYVSSDNSLHVIWDNWKNVYYSAFIDGKWSHPKGMPKGQYKRNFSGQITGDSNSIYIASCAMTKYQGGSSMVYQVKEGAISLVTSYGSSLYYPPALSMTYGNPTTPKNLQVLVGGGYVNSLQITKGNVLLRKKPIIKLDRGRLFEGLTGFNADGDLGVVSSWYSYELDEGFWANTTSRVRRGRGPVFLGWGEGYPRSAYNETTGDLYVLFQKDGYPFLAAWNPQNDIVKHFGKIADAKVTRRSPDWFSRGAGAGGIAAPMEGEGAHAVISLNDELYYLKFQTGSEL